MNTIENFIECPHCKAQYLPSEIFMPKEFLGTPKNIIKTPNGQIEYGSGDNMDTEEEYTCDFCGTTFKVEANVDFKVSIDEATNFNTDYSSTIYKNRITLEEKENFVKEDLFSENKD